MPLPVSTLVETNPGIVLPGSNPLTRAKLTDPIEDRLIGVSGESTTVTPTSGQDGVVTLIDEFDATSYANVSNISWFRRLTNGIYTLEVRDPTVAAQRGVRLPVTAIQNKAVVTVAAILKYDSTVNSNEVILGSKLNSNSASMLLLWRNNANGLMTASARHTAISDTQYSAAQGSVIPNEEWFAVLVTYGFFDGFIRIQTIREDSALDHDSGKVAAFTGQEGSNSGAPANQGLGIGCSIAASGSDTGADALKWKGWFQRLDIAASEPSDVKFSGSQLSPRDIMIIRLRAIVKRLNG